MEKNMIKTSFSYTDEFSQETKLEKTYTEAVFMDQGSLEFQLEEFKSFLSAQGFSKEHIEKIQLIDKE